MPTTETDERTRWLASLMNQAGDSEKDWWTAFWLSLFLGFFGVDRFYLGFGLTGYVKFMTFGAGGFWWGLDILWLLLNKRRDAYGGLVRRPF